MFFWNIFLLGAFGFFSFLSVESPFHVMTITKNTLGLRPPEAKGYSSLVEGKNYKFKNVS